MIANSNKLVVAISSFLSEMAVTHDLMAELTKLDQGYHSLRF